MDLFQNFGHLIAGAALFFSSFLGHNTAHLGAQNAQPTVTIENTTSGSFYTASHSISYQGYSVNMTVTIPKNGGKITGRISGDCNGDITGQYDGKDSGAINGQANISCQVLLVQIPGTVTFTGTVNKDNKNAQLLLTLKVDSFEKSQNVNVSFK